MDMPKTTAQRIARAASAFEERRTGHVPQSVTVVLSEDTLVITLHGILSPAEKDLARSPTGAVEVQEFHRQLFASSSDSLRQEIKRITGVEVCGATAEVLNLTSVVPRRRLKALVDDMSRDRLPCRENRRTIVIVTR
jgi:uncharacterized protein YbcI